jgi:predicted PurR-regulated permease PerM
MSTKRAIPLQPENAGLEEEFKAAARTNATAQAGIAIAVLLAICYVAKLVLVTLIVSVLIAFMLEPIVIGLGRLRLPRPAGSFIAVLLALAVAYAVSYWSYDRAASFSEELPNYATKIRSALSYLPTMTASANRASVILNRRRRGLSGSGWR